MTAVDAETGLPIPIRPSELPRTIGSVFVRVGGSDVLIELGSSELAVHKVGADSDKALTTLSDIAAVLRDVADKIDVDSTPSQAAAVRGRHFAPYGGSEATCGVPVFKAAWDLSAGDYCDDRYTTRRDRTTCPECLAKIDPTDEGGAA